MRVLPFALFCLTTAPLLAEQANLPAGFPASRYEHMESPFGLASPPPPPPTAPKDSFTKDWVLTGLSKYRDAQGIERDFVAIKTRDQTQQFHLYGDTPSADGVTIASVERSPMVGKSKVTLKKGGEFGTVEYNQMEIQSQVPASGPAGNGRTLPGGIPQPMNPGVNNAFRPPVPGGRPQVPRPNGLPQNGGTIQPPIVQPQNLNGAAPLPGAANANDPRRRIRVINSKP